MTKEEAERLMKDQKAKGRTLEVIPSKLVFTRKPAPPPKNYKNKMRWVVCGNYEAKKEHEETYSGGADSTAFRLMMAISAQNQWCGGSVDIKTAFLNAYINYEQEDDLVLIKPPHFLVEKNYVEKDMTYLPLKAVYGFRRSPRLWSQQRDLELADCEIVIKEGGKRKRLSLTSLQSEPNLWKISERESEENINPTLEGLLMTYVDDIFVTGSEQVVTSVLEKISSMWTTSPAERVTQKPIRFLGMEISKVWNPSTLSEDWFVNQESYIKELVNKYDELKVKKIPITKDHASLSVPEVTPTADTVKLAQKQVGECLWLVTRSRPDIMFAVSKMGSLMTRDPIKVSAMMDQLLGYLKLTEREGLVFKKNENEEKVISAYSDASFAPEGECSHGCSIITYNGTPVLWKSSRQPMVTLSTAESELIELVEAMTAGESVSVVAEELQEGVVRMAWCDNQSTVAILSQENGNWRTRHLRIRSSFARTVVLNGQWALQHLRGQEMVADIGTKALSAVRLQQLKELLCIGVPMKNEEDEVKEEKKTTSATTRADLEVVYQALRALTVAAVLEVVAGSEEEEWEKEESSQNELFWFLWVYTMLVIFVTWRIRFWAMSLLNWGRWIAEKTARKKKEIEEDEEKEDEVLRPEVLERSEVPHEDDHEECQLQDGKGKSEGVERQAPLSGGSQEAKNHMARRPMIPMKKSGEEVPSSSTSTTRTTIGQVFKPITLKYGAVYHTDMECSYIKSSQTGSVRRSSFCARCFQALAATNQRMPRPGDPIMFEGWGRDFHVTNGCSSFFGAPYNQCSRCAGSCSG